MSAATNLRNLPLRAVSLAVLAVLAATLLIQTPALTQNANNVELIVRSGPNSSEVSATWFVSDEFMEDVASATVNWSLVSAPETELGPQILNNPGDCGNSVGGAVFNCSADGKVFSWTLAGLTNGSPYNVRVTITGSEGATAESGSQSVLPIADPSSVLTIGEPTNITDRGATVEVTIANPDTVDGLNVRLWRRTPAIAEDTTTTPPTPAVPAGDWVLADGPENTTTDSVSFTFTGLTPGTTYDLRASLEESPYTLPYADLSPPFMTKNVPSAPTNLAINDADGTLTVTWDPPANDGDNDGSVDAITGYKVHWKSGDEDYDATDREHEITCAADLSNIGTGEVDCNLGGERTYEISDLTNETEYTIRVVAVNEFGDGVPAEGTGIPASEAMVRSVDVVFTSKTEATVTVRFSNPDDSTDPVQEVWIRYRRTEDADDVAWERAQQAPSFTSDNEVEITLSAIDNKVDDPNSDLDPPATIDGRVEYIIQASLNELVTEVVAPPDNTVVNTFTTPVEPSAPLNLAIIPADGRLIVSWDPPADDGGSEVTDYTVQHAEVDSFDDGTEVENDVDAGMTTYTITGLENDTEYYVRVSATTAAGTGAWSSELEVTPWEGAAVTGLSAMGTSHEAGSATATIEDAVRDTTEVYLQYRTSAVSGSAAGDWLPADTPISMTASEAGTTTVDLTITGLEPETSYDVRVSLDSDSLIPPDTTEPTTIMINPHVTVASFRTGVAPPILELPPIWRIEPAISSVTLGAGERVRLGVDAYGVQDIHDNSLAAPGVVSWSDDSAGGSFATPSNERTVVYTASSRPGSHTVTATVADESCLDAEASESAEDVMSRCTAEFTIVVRRRSVGLPEDAAPVNPSGPIPSTLTDSSGTAYAVFTPVEGGSFLGESFSLHAGAGAVANGEYIGLRMSEGDDASNVGMTWQRYTLMGHTYSIEGVDSSRAALSDYRLASSAEACVPLPDALRGHIADVSLTAVNEDDTLTVLTSRVRIADGGSLQLCGHVSSVPAVVAAGAQGAPEDFPTATPEPPPPDTGGAAPASSSALFLLLLGIALAVTGSALLLRRRKPSMTTS